MKYLFAAAVLVATSFASFSAANAAGGYGPGWHRGPYGGCQVNRGGVVVVERPAPVVVVRPVGRVCPTASSGPMDVAARSERINLTCEKPRLRGAFLCVA